MGVKLENIVFIELKRRGYDVFYHADKKECDFVVREGMRIMKAYQVTIVMNDEKTRKPEIEGLMEAMNAYGLAEGYILTMEEKEELEIDGILFTFSCSQVVTKDQFRNAVFTAAAQAGRKVRILHQLHQPADHPINIYHPEGEYLKGLVLYVE